jgi:hypothetical protein
MWVLRAFKMLLYALMNLVALDVSKCGCCSMAAGRFTGQVHPAPLLYFTTTTINKVICHHYLRGCMQVLVVTCVIGCALLPCCSICNSNCACLPPNACVTCMQVLVVTGETGCGKSTQVPQFILEAAQEAGQLQHTNIVVSQPRRLITTCEQAARWPALCYVCCRLLV